MLAKCFRQILLDAGRIRRVVAICRAQLSILVRQQPDFLSEQEHGGCDVFLMDTRRLRIPVRRGILAADVPRFDAGRRASDGTAEGERSVPRLAQLLHHYGRP
jgi:hypothetical protein